MSEVPSNWHASVCCSSSRSVCGWIEIGPTNLEDIVTVHAKVIPTLDRPARAIPVYLERLSVQGDYQAVVTFDGKPTKGQLLLAYSEACRSLAELAEKWACEEGVAAEGSNSGTEEGNYRIIFNMSLRPERGVNHDEAITIAPRFEGL